MCFIMISYRWWLFSRRECILGEGIFSVGRGEGYVLVVGGLDFLGLGRLGGIVEFIVDRF